MKRFLAPLALALLLSGCILSASPANPEAEVAAGDELTFSIKAFASAAIVWSVDGAPVNGATGKSFTWTAPANAAGSIHTVSVIEQSRFSGATSRTWAVTVLPPVLATITDQAQAEDLLAWAHAGIAYGQAASPADDTTPYRAMISDLTTAGCSAIMDTLANDPDIVAKLTRLMNPLYRSATFTHATDTCTTTVGLRRGNLNLATGFYPFTATVALDVSPDGHTLPGFTWYGAADVSDLAATITGSFKATINPPGLDRLVVRNVSITASPTLSADYAHHTVTYDTWTLAFTLRHGPTDPDYPAAAPLNLHLLPPGLAPADDLADNRDYTLGGALAINDAAATFTALRYRQTGADLAITGALSTPALEGLVNLEAAAITRDPAGPWTDGTLTLTDLLAVTTIDFADPDADFSHPDLGEWTVQDWQEDLEF